MLEKKYAGGNVPLDGGMASAWLQGGEGGWIGRRMILFVGYSLFARNQPSRLMRMVVRDAARNQVCIFLTFLNKVANL